MAGKSQNVDGDRVDAGRDRPGQEGIDAIWKLGSGARRRRPTPPTRTSSMREAVLWAILSGAAISVGPAVPRPPARPQRAARSPGREGRPSLSTDSAETRSLGHDDEGPPLRAAPPSCLCACVSDQAQSRQIMLLRVRELAAVVHEEAAHAGELVVLPWAGPRRPAPRARGRRRAARRTRPPRPRPRRPCPSSCRAASLELFDALFAGLVVGLARGVVVSCHGMSPAPPEGQSEFV